MEEWKEYKLGDIISIKSGFAYKGKDIGFGSNFLLGMGCVSFKEKFLDSGVRLYNGECSDKYCVKTGDIVLATRQQSDNLPILGMPAIIPNGYDGKKIIVGANLYKVENKSDFDNRYLFWLLKSPSYIDYIKSCQTGTTVRMITKSNIESYTFRAPNSNNRNKIVSILSSLDDKIEVNRRINEQLEELAQALFKSWFVDFEPFKDGEFVESELGMIPEGWKVVSLGELMKYSGGSQPPASEFIEEYKEGYIRFIQIRDYASESHITYIPISKKNKLCDVKDIMIARYGASLGRICYGLKGAYNVALAKVTPLKEYYREYLRCYLSSKEFYEGLNMKGNRAVQAGFNQGDIDSFMLSFPTNENIIMKYEAVSALLFEERLHNQQEIIHLTNLRDTLLPKLMSGEIDVNEVKI